MLHAYTSAALAFDTATVGEMHDLMVRLSDAPAGGGKSEALQAVSPALMPKPQGEERRDSWDDRPRNWAGFD